jgi:hypothetical protein
LDKSTKNVSLARRALRENYDRIKNKKQTNTFGSPPSDACAQIDSLGAAGKAGQARCAVYDCTCPGAVPAVQARLGCRCGENAERARHEVCVPVLPGFTPRARAGARVPQTAPRAMDQAAAG